MSEHASTPTPTPTPARGPASGAGDAHPKPHEHNYTTRYLCDWNIQGGFRNPAVQDELDFAMREAHQPAVMLTETKMAPAQPGDAPIYISGRTDADVIYRGVEARWGASGTINYGVAVVLSPEPDAAWRPYALTYFPFSD